MKKYFLNRTTKQRKALFKGLVTALIEHESIETTNAKAKAVRSIFEKLLTVAKSGTVATRRNIQSYIQDKDLVKKLVDTIAPAYKEVKGGYTTVKMVGQRRGDNAPIVRLSLTKKSAPLVAPAKKDKKSAKPAKKSVKPSPTPAPVKVDAKVSKTQVVKGAGRIGFRQGER